MSATGTFLFKFKKKKSLEKMTSAFLSTAREMKTLAFAEALKWLEEELASRRTRRQESMRP